MVARRCIDLRCPLQVALRSDMRMEAVPLGGASFTPSQTTGTEDLGLVSGQTPIGLRRLVRRHVLLPSCERRFLMQPRRELVPNQRAFAISEQRNDADRPRPATRGIAECGIHLRRPPPV